MLDFCVCCGEYVPEGTMVCRSCWKRYMEGEEKEDREAVFPFIIVDLYPNI